MMKRARQLLAATVAFFAVWASTIAFAQSSLPASFWTTPNPPPADQEFAATLRILVNPGVWGIWPGEGQVPSNIQIDGNLIRIPFDIGCGFICPPSEPAYTNFPFVMPALPIGAYVIQFVDSPTPPASVYAEFNITVGYGEVAPSTALPTGGEWNALLGGVLLLMACLWIRRQTDKRRSQN